MSAAPRVFLLSPAHCGGLRATMLMREAAQFGLARALRAPAGAPLGDVFTFMSGLYFRGKLAYARAFARPPAGVQGVLVITPTSGLMPADAPVTVAQLRKFATIDIHEADGRYRRPLAKSARALAAAIPSDCEIVILGSIATAKYVDVLGRVFGARLLFPPDFVGRGDMSRGGLLLRCARAARELPYAPVLGATLHGKRPPRLPRRARGSSETHVPVGTQVGFSISPGATRREAEADSARS
jgi:hypothetical protein